MSAPDDATGARRLTLDGRPLAARPGQSVAAALTEQGIRSWRTTRGEGRPRGLFCGIGVCYDCLITVDGVPNQRACLVPARDGMRLSTTEPALPDRHHAARGADTTGRDEHDGGHDRGDPNGLADPGPGTALKENDRRPDAGGPPEAEQR